MLNNRNALAIEIRNVGFFKVRVFWKKFGKTRLRKITNTRESRFAGS